MADNDDIRLSTIYVVQVKDPTENPLDVKWRLYSGGPPSLVRWGAEQQMERASKNWHPEGIEYRIAQYRINV